MTDCDPFHPAVPAGAYDELLTRVLPQAGAQRARTPEDGPLPPAQGSRRRRP